MIQNKWKIYNKLFLKVQIRVYLKVLFRSFAIFIHIFIHDQCPMLLAIYLIPSLIVIQSIMIPRCPRPRCFSFSSLFSTPSPPFLSLSSYRGETAAAIKWLVIAVANLVDRPSFRAFFDKKNSLLENRSPVEYPLGGADKGNG